MRILVVEDDRLLNNTLCYNLNTAGYAVDSALTKSAAGSFLTEQDYDLIVLDVNLPDGNGFDVLTVGCFNFVSYPADSRGQSVFIHKISVCVPQLFQQDLPGQNNLRIFRQDFQKSIFQWGECKWLS